MPPEALPSPLYRPHTMARPSCLLGAIGAAVLLAPLASADLITWGPVQDATSGTDVSTNGLLVTAKNPWASTFVQPTVNGVMFEAFAPLGWTNGGWDLNAGSTSGDTEYDALLDSARVSAFGAASNPTGWGIIQLDTLGTLTMGSQYEIQVWFSDQRTGNGSNLLFDREMTISSCTGNATISAGEVQNLGSLNQGPNSGLLNADPNDTNGPGDTILGSFVTGTFTRTTTEPLYLLIQGTHAASTNLRPHINAFQIRAITAGPIGTNFCMAAANSIGQTGTMSANGSLNVVNNDVTLTASDLPPNQFGIFVTSMIQGFVPGAGGTSNGNICLGGAIGRYTGPGLILSTGAAGTFSLPIDLTAMPQGNGTVAAMAGQSWNFQAWHRDSVGLGSNFTDGLELPLL